MLPFEEGGNSGSAGPGRDGAAEDVAAPPAEGGYGDRVDLEMDHEEVKARIMKDPELPSKEEIAIHEVVYIHHRSWCRICVMGRGRSIARVKFEAAKTHIVPTIGQYYGSYAHARGEVFGPYGC